MSDYKTIAESKNFIVLDKYTAEWKAAEGYQTEEALECELIQDLVNQGYEFVPDLTSQSAMLANVRVQLQTLNQVVFNEGNGGVLPNSILLERLVQHLRVPYSPLLWSITDSL